MPNDRTPSRNWSEEFAALDIPGRDADEIYRTDWRRLYDFTEQLLRALPSESERKGVFVPQEVWDWLMGEGPNFLPSPEQLTGSAFALGRYWWRSQLRKKIEEAGK